MKKLLAVSLLMVVGLKAYSQQSSAQKPAQPQNQEQQCVEKQVVVPTHPNDSGKYHEEIEQTRVVTVLDCGESEPISDEIKEKAKEHKAKIPGHTLDGDKP